jgi:hypothetical protein
MQSPPLGLRATLIQVAIDYPCREISIESTHSAFFCPQHYRLVALLAPLRLPSMSPFPSPSLVLRRTSRVVEATSVNAVEYCSDSTVQVRRSTSTLAMDASLPMAAPTPSPSSTELSP